MSPVNAPASIGKEYNFCLGHCLAKLLRQVFAVWTKDCDFDLDFESRPQAIAESTTTAGKRSPAPTAINEPTPALARAVDRLTASPRRSHRDLLTLPGETESNSAGPCSARCPQLDKG